RSSQDSATFPAHAPQKGAPAPRPAPAATPSPLSAADGYLGVVLARQAVVVQAETDGRLGSVVVRVGDKVTKGMELARLVTEDLVQSRIVAESTLQAARADAQKATVELENARGRYERRQKASDLFSAEDLANVKAQVDEGVTAVASAKARVVQEEAHLRQIDFRLARATLRSPIDGRVATRFLDPGAVVAQGTRVLRIISSQDFLLRFAVPPERSNALHAGQPVRVKLDSLPVTLSGLISNVAPQIDTASQMVFVEASLAVPADWATRLQDGLVGHVTAPAPAV
ncbi:MAG TPA: efflux RND transporter periplasmic adaptor subunit, partial [Thermoanaerobaculia bacterium]